MSKIFHPLLALIASAGQNELAKYVEYLKHENKILRAWVHRPTAEVIKQRSYKRGEWTDLDLSAIDGHIVVKINGVVSSELKKDTGRRKGHLGLQLHGGQNMHVEFRDIMILEK